MERRHVLVSVLVVLVFATAIAGVVSAQADRSAPQVRASDEPLVTEIRALRADLNNALSASIRAQLLVGRLQLQEQRINSANAQLRELRNLVSVKQSDEADVAGKIQRMEQVLRGSLPSPDVQKQVEWEVAELKRKLAQAQTDVQQLRAQEAELAGHATSEQGRWIYFNDRLDEIERALSQVTQ
jgi:predicted  nucleic acid-binding Zn-ribbon protein